MLLEKEESPEDYSSNSVNCEFWLWLCRCPPTLIWVNWVFKLIIKLSFKLDEMNINLITSIIFILQVLEEDAQNKKKCLIHIIWIEYHQIY